MGKIENPTTQLAVAVGASSAFPPVLSPARLKFKSTDFMPGTGFDLQRPPFTEDVALSDGGVYDNLGLETAWKNYDTIFVSDAGGKIAPEEKAQGDWAHHALRVNDLIDNQVRSLRKRQVIGSFESGDRKGAYWGIRTDIAAYQLPNPLPGPLPLTTALAELPTRFKALDAPVQERLINWGYAVCDAAIRRHVDPGFAAPAGFPYRDVGVGVPAPLVRAEV